jgi:superfamily II DNA or RNA helicase
LRDASPLAEHQLAAAERLDVLLERYGGALLADEPGLGKSFVAAEVARRAWSRGRGVEAIVPASLVPQWEETFRRFGVRGEVITHASLLGRSEERGPALMIVDEAHAFRNPATQRYAALARRSAGAALLLVTATPVCNTAADLEALLRLIAADDALMLRGVPSIDAAFERRDRELIAVIASELLIRRDRSVLPPALAFGDLDRRVIWSRNGNDEVDRQIAAMEFPLVSGAPLVRDFLQRRLESSEAALLESLRRQRRFYERALECLAAGRALPKREYRRAFAHEEDAAAFQTILFWDLFVDQSAGADGRELEAAVARIDELRAAVEALPRRKERRLVELCAATPEPMLIFTGWTVTARAIETALRSLRRCALVTGRERTNAAAIEAFRRGVADVLISTDVGAEGLNLQRAGVVVHYDLPWNPVKVDQRNGRAHRIGQSRSLVRAVYFLTESHRDEVLQRVTAKNRVRRRLLRHAPAAEAPPWISTARPRIAAGAAVIAFAAAVERGGWRVPEALLRRHKAGIELILHEMASAPITTAALRELESLLSAEPWARSRECRFTLL